MGKKLLSVVSFILLSNSFIVRTATAVSARSTTNIVVAHHGRKKTVIDKAITSEQHRHKQAQKKPVPKYLKKKMSKISITRQDKISKIVISGNKAVTSEQIKCIIAPYLSKIITKKEAKLISNDIENYYRKKGYLLPVAHVEINGSILKIKIVEGKIKDVLVVFGNIKRDKKVLNNQHFLNLVTKIKTANPIKTKELEKYLLLIGKIHGYTIDDYELEPLDKISGNNVSNLVIKIETQKGTASVSVDNAGTTDLGKNQVSFSAQAFNPISNDSIILDAQTSNEPKKLQMITGGYLKRLNSYGTSASVLASYLGYSSTSGPKYSKSVMLRGRIGHYIFLNYDYSFKLEVAAEQHYIKYYDQTTKTSGYKYMLGSIGSKIKITDPLDVENWFFPYFNWALDKVSYEADSEQAINFDRNFNYFTIDWYRNQPLPKNFSLFLKASYQNTSKLLPTEYAYSIGASNTGRGYGNGLVSADQGISGIVELRYTKEFKDKKIKKFLKTGQIFGFYDVTHFIDHNKDINSTNHPDAVSFDKSTLPAVGVGVRLFFPYGIYGEGTAEYPTVKNITVDGTKHKNEPLYMFLVSKEFNW